MANGGVELSIELKSAVGKAILEEVIEELIEIHFKSLRPRSLPMAIDPHIDIY
jgi:hypothetical protein